MSIQFTCNSCDAKHLVNDRFAGKRVRCPKCESPMLVPMESEVEVAPVEAGNSTGDAEPSFASLSSVGLRDKSDAATLNESHAKSSVHSSHSGTSKQDADDDEDDDPVLARQRRPEEEMDMTPMVDVTFLLLIFFMVTAAFSLQKSIEMPRQQTDAPSTSVQEEEVEELDMVELQVDEFGSFLVMAPEWERETPGKQNLISALREAIAGNSDGMRLVVKVHEMAKLKSLVDAMDAGTIAGYAQLEVTQVEEFD